ncbi:hypothetical protein M422DRAFT_47040 [Sphaerobolus stellatus SS14]|uniref:Uncharacterized protein n=1 Tax=Sphaerobolus stellatus (strain SS14) TaxID=990650 RepID=A0A0C9VDW9_SPHS4|nr:hypothetical protein M422DRAFT_47040 [Sphaerobolus stellatus SS14]
MDFFNKKPPIVRINVPLCTTGHSYTQGIESSAIADFKPLDQEYDHILKLSPDALKKSRSDIEAAWNERWHISEPSVKELIAFAKEFWNLVESINIETYIKERVRDRFSIYDKSRERDALAGLLPDGRYSVGPQQSSDRKYYYRAGSERFPAYEHRVPLPPAPKGYRNSCWRRDFPYNPKIRDTKYKIFELHDRYCKDCSRVATQRKTAETKKKRRQKPQSNLADILGKNRKTNCPIHDTKHNCYHILPPDTSQHDSNELLLDFNYYYPNVPSPYLTQPRLQGPPLPDYPAARTSGPTQDDDRIPRQGNYGSISITIHPSSPPFEITNSNGPSSVLSKRCRETDLGEESEDEPRCAKRRAISETARSAKRNSMRSSMTKKVLEVRRSSRLKAKSQPEASSKMKTVMASSDPSRKRKREPEGVECN